MIAYNLSQIRSDLATMDTGANRRLLYPASGDDVGCSVGLFWAVCDSFYLVDPFFGQGIDIDKTLQAMAEGKARYMAGMEIESDAGSRLTFDGVPGVRYQVWLKNAPHARKRLCFIRSTTDHWLEQTTTRYNVILNKDYAGIDDDSPYPYATAWDRLNSNGIFAETLGTTRTGEAFDFIKYRCLGFEPWCKATTDEGDQIGFANGLHLFRKRCHYHVNEYTGIERDIEAVSHAVNGILGDFIGANDAAVEAASENMEDSEQERTRAKGLLEVMRATKSNSWAMLEKQPAFLDWLLACLQHDHPEAIKTIKRLNPTKGVGFTANFLRSALEPLRMNTWGAI